MATWRCSPSEDRKAAVSCFRCRVPGSSLLARGGQAVPLPVVWAGEAGSSQCVEPGSWGAPGSQWIHGGDGPPPPPLTHLPGRWWATGVVGSSRDFSLLGSRSQESDFKTASLVVGYEIEIAVSPHSLSWCPLTYCACSSCGWPWQSLEPCGQGGLCPCPSLSAPCLRLWAVGAP